MRMGKEPTLLFTLKLVSRTLKTKNCLSKQLIHVFITFLAGCAQDEEVKMNNPVEGDLESTDDRSVFADLLKTRLETIFDAEILESLEDLSVNMFPTQSVMFTDVVEGDESEDNWIVDVDITKNNTPLQIEEGFGSTENGEHFIEAVNSRLIKIQEKYIQKDEDVKMNTPMEVDNNLESNEDRKAFADAVKSRLETIFGAEILECLENLCNNMSQVTIGGE